MAGVSYIHRPGGGGGGVSLVCCSPLVVHTPMLRLHSCHLRYVTAYYYYLCVLETHLWVVLQQIVNITTKYGTDVCKSCETSVMSSFLS